MKNQIILLSFMAFSVGTITMSCSPNEKKINDAQSLSNAQDNPHDYADTINVAKQDWDKFQNDAQARLSRNADTIAALRVKISKSKADVKDKLDKDIAHLEEANRQLKQRVDQYQEMSIVKWNKFKADFNKEMDSLDVRAKEVFADDSK